MPQHSLTPVFTALRTCLHLLVAVLLGLVLARILVGEATSTPTALVLSAAFAAVYLAGAWLARAPTGRRRGRDTLWLLALTLLWGGLLIQIPEAAYLVFPLFFLYLHLLPTPAGPLAVLVATAIAIVAIGLHSEFTVGGVVGPLVGAGVALMIGLGYRALAREAAEREALVAELVATRDLLAATEREQGILTERARLGREIHDTIAQGLSSIQMLLHAAERAEPGSAGNDHVRLARQTSADVLAETRRFIRELTPPTLDQGLPGALRRLAAAQSETYGLPVSVEVPDRVDVTMDAQTALLRVAQGALANVVQHAHASHVLLRLVESPTQISLTVSDDGVGFDPGSVARARSSDSFGLRSIEDRIAQIGGTVDLASVSPGGTTLTVTLPRSAA
ncbi:sensor histidine kinase [Nocardioides sp.]|uniref:sensor histidine kinase n=1 Tax=Nocardioides sp. TaxID=35761 RepID=UPI0026166BFC|nr:sensor histidine kinase [Nocardioides sp.]